MQEELATFLTDHGTKTILLILIAMSLLAYHLGRRRASSFVQGTPFKLHSLPQFHGWYVLLWCALPAFMILVAWNLLEDTFIMQHVIAGLPPALQGQDDSALSLLVNDIRNQVEGGFAFNQSATIEAAAREYIRLERISRAIQLVLLLSIAAATAAWGLSRQRRDSRMRNAVEKVMMASLLLCSSVAILTTVGIVLSVLFESLRFFQAVPFFDFLFGLEWSPQTAIRVDQVGSTGKFGAIPLFAGTLLIAFIAMVVAVPIGLFSAIYLSEYATQRVRAVVKPFLEILAGIPTVVYGFFAALTVAPFIRESGGYLGLDVASESALAAGLVMGVMIIPFISSLSDDVINAVPQSLRDGSLALGSTRSETICKVVFPAALPGIVGGILLAVSRAIGETMIVAMAAGLAANLTANPLEAVTTVTVQIVTLLTGDQEFDSPKTLAAFALGLMLFVVTLILNIIALQVVRKYREQYE